MPDIREVKCGKCGWVHFARSRAVTQTEVDRFNDYFNVQTDEVKASFGGEPSKIENYERCFRCGASYKQMVAAGIGDCPNGSTIQPTINPEE